MKLRQTPGGTWCGTEKDYLKALKAEGIARKDYKGREFVEVPTDKPGLMEFLTFHSVNCISPNSTRGSDAAAGASPLPPPAPAVALSDNAPAPDLDELYEAAPIATQLRLAISGINNAHAEASRALAKQ